MRPARSKTAGPTRREPNGPALTADRPRLDLRIDHDARGLVFGPRGAEAKAGFSRAALVEEALREGRHLAVWIGTKSAGVVRLVLGPLDEEESAEWVGRLTGRLRLPKGVLSFAGVDVTVPSGDYLVEALCCLPQALDADFWTRSAPRRKPVAAWFRSTRPKEPFPDWLAARIAAGFESDPGHEAERKALAPAEKRRLVRVGEMGDRYVDLIVRLAPLPADLQPSPAVELAHGFFAPDWEIGKPKRCPRGIEAASLVRPEDSE